MPLHGSPTERFARVEAAFAADGFTVRYFPDPGDPAKRAGCREVDGRIGVMAEHASAKNRKTGKPKKAFYLEGDNRTMGYLLGLMAEEDVARMTGEYAENVVFAFFNSDEAVAGGVLEPLKDLLVHLVFKASEGMRDDIPREYQEELEGILEGCRAANPATTVEASRLWALNFGIDCVLAHVYTGKLFSAMGIKPRVLKTALACNAFSISGAAAGGKHFFGRDFMFPTAGVFQDTACLIVYNPDDRGEKRRHAFASQTAPGIVGTMAAMNSAGVAIGVNMLPSPFCDPDRPGFNSLALSRDCVQYCSSAEEAVERIAQAPRGVSWLYPVADGGGAAYMIEAGRRLSPGERFPYFASVPWYYRRRLPRRRYIRRMRMRYGTPAPRRGLIARAGDYRYPEDYLPDWNERLYRAFNKNWPAKLLDFILDLPGIAADALGGKLDAMWRDLKREVEELAAGADFSAADFSERGRINSSWDGINCPGPFYFAPQRESREDVALATNAFISPEMRLTAMSAWTAILARANLNDIQWRYDELNREILEALDASPGGIDEPTAWRLVNFLASDGAFPAYYNPEGKLDWRDVKVHGSVTLCELTGKTMKSLFGYYGDSPVTIHLAGYL